MASRIEMVGKRYGRLIVLSDRDKNGNLLGRASYRLVKIRCDCGNEKIVSARGIRKKHTRSCGCLQREIARVHGFTGDPLYPVCKTMIARCHNKKSISYKNYGARGIRVCREWRESPGVFIAWAKAAGWEKGLQVDRLNNNGDYCPENCRVVTRSKNLNNKRTNVFIFVDGTKMTLAEATRYYQISYDVLRQRIHKLGWSHEKSVHTPVRKLKRKKHAQQSS